MFVVPLQLRPTSSQSVVCTPWRSHDSFWGDCEINAISSSCLDTLCPCQDDTIFTDGAVTMVSNPHGILAQAAVTPNCIYLTMLLQWHRKPVSLNKDVLDKTRKLSIFLHFNPCVCVHISVLIFCGMKQDECVKQECCIQKYDGCLEDEHVHECLNCELKPHFS